ncbi:hypothetical protein [Geomesophilobacter sediminis]|uniref:Uncharacterized protein n=1 Tax=Geomesophilobacter sediminis TaxID=2798584 RepID=A0A8J7J4F9_9BACT|nr:hypothetical protein [Geomesophilobacter sediminis]MBJ6725743.1 hypothetical protein [Geomesophilobacter sediminis]
MTDVLDFLDLNFSRFAHDNLHMRGGSIADLLMVHPVFLEQLPEVVVPPQEIKQLAIKFRDLVNAAAKGGSDRIVERNQAREELIIALTIAGHYLEMVAVKRNDLTLLENSGFRMKSRYGARTISTDREPEHVPVITKVKRGKKSGSFVVQAKRHPGRVVYVLSVSTGDPVDESSYRELGHFLQCQNEFNGYEAATKLNLRLQYDINGNRSDWSAPVTYIVT